MGLPVENRRYTVREYLRLEQNAADKHEYRAGRVIAIAGGSHNHSLIAANVIRELGNALEGKPCRVYDSNLRVRSSHGPLYTYPDITVICGEPQFDQDDPNGETVTNPRVIIEILSPSTEAYDRGAKFRAYLALDSLEEYVLISQDAPRVETFYRQADGPWLVGATEEGETSVRLRALGIDLATSRIYRDVQFPPLDDAAS